MVIWYVLRSPLRPLARRCIFDASIMLSKSYLPGRWDWKGFFFNESPYNIIHCPASLALQLHQLTKREALLPSRCQNIPTEGKEARNKNLYGWLKASKDSSCFFYVDDTCQVGCVFSACTMQSLHAGSMPTQMVPHAYAKWKGCLITREFSWIRCLRRCLRRVLCWMVTYKYMGTLMENLPMRLISLIISQQPSLLKQLGTSVWNLRITQGFAR